MFTTLFLMLIIRNNFQNIDGKQELHGMSQGKTVKYFFVFAGQLWPEAADRWAAEDARALQGASQQVCDHEQEAANREGVCTCGHAQACLH